MIYKCRVKKPVLNGTGWYDIEAESAPEAAQKLIWDNECLPVYTYINDPTPTTRETITFALVEVEGDQEYITRNYHGGIHRRGGIKTKTGIDYLKRIADGLGYDGDPKELLEPGWDLEEDTWA